jgi:CO/xanthine dehydrogenase FAD-binding subunit
MEYAAPTRLADALEFVAGGARVPVAGGTDFYPVRVGRPNADSVLDLTGLEELRGIDVGEAGVRIGATTTWAEIAAASLPEPMQALQQAAAVVGGVQVQNAGTIGGNLANASPAADGIPPLLALDASVELASTEGRRIVPLPEFLLGYRATALRPGELITSVAIPATALAGRSAFLKLGSRSHLVISIVMVAARLVVDGTGRIETARVAVGACAPTAERLASLESRITGSSPGDIVIEPADLAQLQPIDDPRATAEYRREAARVLVRRALEACAP